MSRDPESRQCTNRMASRQQGYIEIGTMIGVNNDLKNRQ